MMILQRLANDMSHLCRCGSADPGWHLESHFPNLSIDHLAISARLPTTLGAIHTLGSRLRVADYQKKKKKGREIQTG